MTTDLHSARFGRVFSSSIRWFLWLLLAFMMLFPFYWGLVTSFKPPVDLVADPPIFWPTKFSAVENYKVVLSQIPMGRFFVNSIYVASISTLAVLFTSSLAGYIFEKFDFPGKDVIFMGIVATMIIPFLIRVIPVYLVFKDIGILDTLLSLYIAALMSAYGIFLMRQSMKSIPDDLLHAARIDGSSEFGIYRRIILPLSKPTLAALGIFHFMGEWESFLWPLIVIDDLKKRTLPLGITLYMTGYGLLEYHKIMAVCMLSMIPVIIVFLFGQRQFIEGITLTGLKG